MFSWTMRGLHSKDPRMRRYTAFRLGERGKADAVLPLMTVLENDSDRETGENAASALAKLGDARAVPVLAGALLGTTPSGRELEGDDAVAEALAAFGAAALSPLLSALESKHRATRKVAARCLGRLGDRKAISALVARLDDEQDVAGEVADALRALDWWPTAPRDRVRVKLLQKDDEGLRRIAPEVADTLIDVVRDRDQNREHRVAAAAALGYSGTPDAIAPLVAAMEEPDIVEAAAGALTQLRWTPATLDGRIRLATAASDVRALIQLGNKAVPALIELSERSPGVSRDAIRALARIGGEDAIAAVKRTLYEGNDWTRDLAVESLLASPDPAAGDVLVGAMEAPGPLKYGAEKIAKEMASHAGAMRDALVRALRSSDAAARRAAATALAETGWVPETIEEQVEFFAEAGRWDDVAAIGAPAAPRILAAATHPAPGLRLVAIEALGRGGAEWARPILVTALGDSVYAVRNAAASGLRSLGLDEVTAEVKPTPGECAFCGEVLAEGIVFDAYAVGRAVAVGGPTAADQMLRAACACTCGLRLCYPCYRYGKYRCPDCGAALG